MMCLYTHTDMNACVEITNCVRNGRSKMKSRKLQTKLIDPNVPRPIPTRYCTHSHILHCSIYSTHDINDTSNEKRNKHPVMLFLNANEMKAAAVAAAAVITPKKNNIVNEMFCVYTHTRRRQLHLLSIDVLLSGTEAVWYVYKRNRISI